ncbi:hypothetical protein ABEX78_33410 [Priestia megaterium]
MGGKRFVWTDSKLRKLHTYFSVTPTKELAKLLKCSSDTVNKKARELGLKKINTSWSEEQDEYLKTHYAIKEWGEMESELGKRKGKIITRAQKLGLKRNRIKPYSVIDKEYVSIHYNGYNLHKLAKKFKVPPERMYAFIKQYKINKKVKITKEISERRRAFARRINRGKTKECPRCGLLSERPTKDFSLDYGTYDALNRMCITCRTEYEYMVRALKESNEQVREENKWLKSIQNQKFQCSVCQETFKGADMNIAKTQFYVSKYCKKCYNKHKKKQVIERIIKKAKGE